MDDYGVTNGLGLKGGPRLRRSCEACRTSKGRCVPSEHPSRCLRCLKDEKQCTFLEAKARSKRARNSRIRVAEMEEKLDDLLALLSSDQTINMPNAAAMPSHLEEESSSPLPEAQYSPRVTPRPDSIFHLFQDVEWSNSTTPSTDNPWTNEQLPFMRYENPHHLMNRCDDVISKGMLSFQEAEESLCRFRTKASSVPFVFMSSSTNLESLRLEKPFLLLAILTVEANHNARLQSQLERHLKETLSRKVIVNGEKSLELLQGLLVYLMWYHYFFNPITQQIYQLCQMACSMAVDLRLDAKTRETPSNIESVMLVPLSYLPETEEQLNARRTYVGCYYVTSLLCQYMRKPNILKYNERLQESAQSLAQAGRSENDFLVSYLLQIRRCSDEINLAFDYDSSLQLPPLDGSRITFLLRSFQSQYEQMWMNFPLKVQMNPAVKLAYISLGIYVKEIGFHASAQSSSSTSISQSWYHSAERNECLLSCMATTKDYLDIVLASENVAILNSTFMESLQLIYTIFVLGSFANSSMDPSHFRQDANVEYYLDSLCTKVKDVMASDNNAANLECLGRLVDLFEQSKISHRQTMLDPSSTCHSIPGRPVFRFMEIFSTIMTWCLDFSAAGSHVPEKSTA